MRKQKLQTTIYVGFRFLGMQVKYSVKKLSDAEIFLNRFKRVNGFVNFVES